MEINRRTAAENEFVMLKKVRGAGRDGGSLEGSLCPLGRDDWDSNFPALFTKSLIFSLKPQHLSHFWFTTALDIGWLALRDGASLRRMG